MTGVAVIPISGVIWLATAIVRSCLAGLQQRNLPELRSGVSIESVNAIVLRGDEKHIVGALGGNGHRRGIEWLRVNFAIHGDLEDLSELCRVYVARRQNRLIQILAGASIVIVVGQNILRAQRSVRRKSQEKRQEPYPSGWR